MYRISIEDPKERIRARHRGLRRGLRCRLCIGPGSGLTLNYILNIIEIQTRIVSPSHSLIDTCSELGSTSN